MNEVWKPIPGYGERYAASSFGQIKSLRRGRILKSNTRPYLRTSLSVDGVEYCVYIHHLVLLAFHGPRPQGLDGCHGDGDYLNNRPDNLRWDTPLSNMKDRCLHGKTQRGDVLNEEVVRRLRNGKASRAEVAAETGAHIETVNRAARGETWAHVGGGN